ncbi:MAG: MYXO-CTERM sorting domain-containing protein, partial [Fimbriimonadaceae bacterium]|nr:MYXO-CTERM sorting domain-containing protein [Fimbriimonadaceae bacterium]
QEVWDTEVHLDIDGVHPSDEGFRLLGNLVASELEVTAASPVPEPGGTALLAAGIALGVPRRRRRSK